MSPSVSVSRDMGYLGFIRNNWAMLGFGFTAVFWGNFGQSFFIAWFGADIQSSLGMSAGTYGSAYSLATLLAALVVVWAGSLVDRVPLRTYTLVVCAGLAMALLVLSQALGLLSLLLGFFLVRLFGQSLLPHTGVTTMARYFDAARGKSISVAMSGVPSGEVVLPILAVAMIGLLGWRLTLIISAVAVFVILIPSMLYLLTTARRHELWRLREEAALRGEKPSQAEPYSLVTGGTNVAHTRDMDLDSASPTDMENAPGRKEVLSDYRFWLALPGLMANPALITGIFIHQNFIVSSKEWTLSWLATCFVVYGIIHWVSSLVAGAMVDRYRATNLLPLFLAPLLLCMLVLAFMPGWWTALLMMGLLGLSAGMSPPIAGSMWAEIYGTRKLGAIRSMNMAIMVLATAVTPVLFGYFIDTGVSAAVLFGGAAIYVLLSLLLLMGSYPANPRPLAGAH